MSRSSYLHEIQLIDTQLYRNNNRLEEIATILADNKEITAAENQLNIYNIEFKTASKLLRDAELKVQTQRLKIKQTDSKLYGGKIRNPKELQDLQDESQALKRYLSILEDRQLECMLEVDDKKDMETDAQAVLDKAVEKAKNLHTKLDTEATEIKIENESLEAKRREKTRSISPNDLTIYERLRKQRFGVAVSEVKDRACSSCGATLTAALAQSARSPSQITYCETCDRILCAT